MEVIDYFHEYKLDGILGLNADYVIANTSKYYSSHDLRLSYKGALETKEYLVSKLLSNLSLTPDHLPYMVSNVLVTPNFAELNFADLNTSNCFQFPVNVLGRIPWWLHFNR